MSDERCTVTTLATFDGDTDELQCVKRAGHHANYYSSEAGAFVPMPTEHRFEFEIDASRGVHS